MNYFVKLDKPVKELTIKIKNDEVRTSFGYYEIISCRRCLSGKKCVASFKDVVSSIEYALKTPVADAMRRVIDGQQ